MSEGVRYGRALLPLWTLEEDMVFLNHGSYGATPRVVLAEQERWRGALERQPVRFINDELPPALREAAEALARFVGAAPERLGFVENASAGVNAVLRSLPWRAGDEVVTTSHVYNAVRNALAFVAQDRGIAVREVPVPMPAGDPEAIVAAVASALGPRTRLLLVDHVASASAVVMPLGPIVALARKRGVPVLVDGAHAPGMLDLDVGPIGADWYVGNCHKWLCAPKGAAFLAVAADAAEVHPTVISHAYGQGFAAEFDKVGTRDASAWLAVPAALAFHEELGGKRLRARNRALALAAGNRLAAALGTERGAADALTGAMAAVRLPWRGPADWPAARRIKARLWADHRIEAHVSALSNALWLRVSLAAYNEEADLDPVPDAVRSVLAALA